MKMAFHHHIQEISIAVAAGATHEMISLSLQQRYPSQSGYSTRSIRRFCAQEGIHYRSGLNNEQLDRMVASRFLAVGRSYGRRTMHGLLSADGVLMECTLVLTVWEGLYGELLQDCK